jgi:hypothetical protein
MSREIADARIWLKYHALDGFLHSGGVMRAPVPAFEECLTNLQKRRICLCSMRFYKEDHFCRENSSRKLDWSRRVDVEALRFKASNGAMRSRRDPSGAH